MIAFFDITESLFNSAYWKKGQDKYKELTINKATGKPRTIHIPSKKLKIIQRLALEKLQLVEKFKPSRNAHGFTPGKSIVTNAIVHRRSKRIIKMDLKDFFPSIHFGRVRGMFMAYPFKFGDKAATIMAQLACLDDKSGILPQGSPLSPYIANMMCRRLDKRLTEVARSHRCYFTRYADDITFSTNDKSQSNIDDLIKETSSIIESEGFVVNKDKTKILTPEERQVVTGVIINDGINVNRRYVRNLRATIYNCERFGIESQLEKNVRDDRSSRPNENASSYHPSINYFLRHLLGKISFYGSVVLSNNQDERNDKNNKLFKRVETYENILYRFYELLKTSKEEFDVRIKKSVKKLISKRHRLEKRLSILAKVENKRLQGLNEFREEIQNKNYVEELNLIDSHSKLKGFAQKMGEKDPRFYKLSLNSNFMDAKFQLNGLLKYPKVDPDKTIGVLHSLKENTGLRELVHRSSNGNISIKDCYLKLCNFYEKEAYYLPWRLREEFDDWKKSLYEVLKRFDENYLIDVIDGELIGDATEELKKNTRFGDDEDTSTILVSEIRRLINDIGMEDDRVVVLIDSKMDIGFYTHVPSILDSIKEILQSLAKRTNKSNKIYINLVKTDDKKNVELTIFNKSKQVVEFNDRSLTQGKLSKVIPLTNGLCEYWIETQLLNGERKIINMHNGRSVGELELSDLKQGFAHRLRFKK